MRIVYYKEKRSNTLNKEIHIHIGLQTEIEIAQIKRDQKLVKMGDTDTDKQHAANTKRERKQTAKRVKEKG